MASSNDERSLKMKNGKFTPEEKEYLFSLDAVDRVTSTQIIYSKQFKAECMRRYNAGDRPSEIFDSVGLPASLIGYKRIERAIYHWKEAQAKDALTLTDAPSVKHDKYVQHVKLKKEQQLKRIREKHALQIELLKSDKRNAIANQRNIRNRRIENLEEKLAKQKAKAKRDKEKIIASQAAEIAALKAQVKALKANGTLEKKTQRAPGATNKSERFEIIFFLKNEDASFNISAACEALEVSRSGYYEWVLAANGRKERESADELAKEQIIKALCYKGFKKGTRQIKGCLARNQGITMNRKKIQRIMRKYDLMPKRKAKRPYHPIGTDGLPKVANNIVNRDFRRGKPLKVLSTDITYLPNISGFSYLSAIIDCETNKVLAHVTSDSMEEQFVLDTYDQLKEIKLPKEIYACSDQGAHYTARAYREKLAEIGINQSMSRKACCWDNAPIESFWGRMKEQIEPTNNMTHNEVICRVDEYIDYYNNERGQKRLNWLTPTEYAETLV